METGVEGLIGAGRYERGGERTPWRNGHRDRVFDTRLGSLQLRIPKQRQGAASRRFGSAVSPWRAWHVRTDRLHHHGPSMPERKWQFTSRAVPMAGPTRGRSIGRVITCGRLPRPSLLWPPDTAGRRDGWRIPARLIDLEGRPSSCRTPRAALSWRQTPRASSIRVSPAKALVRNFKKS